MFNSELIYGFDEHNYLFILESIFDFCRLFSRKRRKKKLSSAQTNYTVDLLITNDREAKI